MKFYNGNIHPNLSPTIVFVFGSNPEGRHGAGAAKTAKDCWGAIYGQGRGPQGRAYALVTKNLTVGYKEKLGVIETIYEKAGERSVCPDMITDNILEFYEYASEHPEKQFCIAYKANTVNLNGYTPEEMWGFFNKHPAPDNVYMHISFKRFLC